jgi:hypothetical protein
MTIRLIDLIHDDLGGSQTLRYESVAEILLSFKQSTRELVERLISVDFTINTDGLLTPFKPKEWEKYIVAEPRYRSGPPMRAEILNRLRNEYDQITLDAWVFPPSDEFGVWRPDSRTFDSVYERRSRQDEIKIDTDLAMKYGITNTLSMEQAIREGNIVLLGGVGVDVTPSGDLNSLTMPPSLASPNGVPQLNVLYRGAAYRYEQPLVPTAYREFLEMDEALNYYEILRFTINLVIEAIHDEFDIFLTHNQAESIIQHYKILPWTRMIDFTSDINIAKAFAARPSSSNICPHLYQVVVWNLGLFDTGSELIKELPLARPRIQSALAHFGLGLGSGSNRYNYTIDRYALVVAVTEYKAQIDGFGWERFGGQSFSIGGIEFQGPFMKDSEYEELQSLLYPPDSDPKAKRALERIVHTLERNINAFPELGTRVDDVQKSLSEVLSHS